MCSMLEKSINDYCTGCGLCEALGKAKLEKDQKGFLHPVNSDIEFLKKVCVSSKKNLDNVDLNKIWGRSEAVYLGWSNNNVIRKKCSSGGILTSLCIYLLEEKIVDSIIHIGADPKDPTKTSVCFSESKSEVINNSGSRYAISHPLKFFETIDYEKKYAFVGKPCDVSILRNYQKIHPEIISNIKYCFSFFCMGTPSEQAQKKLLSELNCSKCISLTYRGNGWPGKTIAINNEGTESNMDYNSSWGNILGRDLMPMCRFCIDGIGEEADISCGDAWYLTKDNTPDFSEHSGRNVIFARTQIGNELLKKLYVNKDIHLEEYVKYEVELPKIQKSQFDRRRNMMARILAMRFFKKSSPQYSMIILKHYAKYGSVGDFLKSFLGTAKRIVSKKI